MRLLLALLSLSFTPAAQPRVSAEHHADRVISGRILQVGSPTPVVAVQAYVRGTRRGTVTNEQGRFELRAVPEGTTELVLRHPCYFDVRVSIPAEGDVTVSVGLPFDSTSRIRPGCGGLDARDADGTVSGGLRRP